MQVLPLHRPTGTARLCDALGWGVMLEPGVVITKQAEWMSVIRYIPRDAASSSPEQLLAARAALNTAIRRFGGTWAVWFECRRAETTNYDSSESWPDPVSRMMDEERRKLFTAGGRQFESQYFVTVLYAPAADAVGRLAAHFNDATEVRDDEKRFRDEYDRFRRGVAAFQHDLDSFMPMTAPVVGDELMTFLHSCVSTKSHWVKMPDLPLFLSEYISDDTFTGGIAPMLGDHHLRTIRIKAQPGETWPGVLDELNNLELCYRWVARWLPYSHADSQRELEARKKAWADRRKGLMQKILGRFGLDDGSRDNVDASRRMDEADAALMALASGDFTFGAWTQTVTLTHPDLDVLEDSCRRVMQIINARGFLSSIAVDDAMSAWIGSLPGHPLGDLGRFLTSSQTFSEVLPGTAVWTGPERDYHLGGPPLLRGMSHGGTPFRLCLHQEGSDVGHFVIVGEIGGGKTTLAGAMVAAHRKYPGAREIIFDRGGGLKGITLALGGDWLALDAGDDRVSLQPLAFIDQPQELAWAFEWVVGCLAQEGLTATPRQKEEITGALQALASRPVRMRTLSLLRAMVQDDAVKIALGTFCLGGACGDLLDGDEHRTGGTNGVVCYETDLLLQRPTALAPVISCLFRDIARTFDGKPTMVFVDEARTFITHPLIAAQLDELIRRGRKEHLHVGIATQSMLDVEQSHIGHIINDSAKMRLFTANAAAREPKTAAALARIGLSERQIDIVASLRAKREYVCQTTTGWRKFELGLSPIELAFVGRGSPQDRKDMDRVLVSGPRETYWQRWLAHLGMECS